MSQSAVGTDREIETAVRKLAGTFELDIPSVTIGVVKSVDENAATCVVTVTNGVDVPNVRLQAAVCDGLLILPVVGSDVVIMSSVQNTPFVVLYSDIDKLYLQVGDSSLTVFNKPQSGGQEIRFNDGKFGGLITLIDPNNPDGGVLARINKLEDDLNKIKTAFATWTPAPNDGGAALKSVASDWAAEMLVRTTKSDIEDKLIVH